jgi:hypothetical protein
VRHGGQYQRPHGETNFFVDGEGGPADERGSSGVVVSLKVGLSGIVCRVRGWAVEVCSSAVTWLQISLVFESRARFRYVSTSGFFRSNAYCIRCSAGIMCCCYEDIVVGNIWMEDFLSVVAKSVPSES